MDMIPKRVTEAEIVEMLRKAGLPVPPNGYHAETETDKNYPKLIKDGSKVEVDIKPKAGEENASTAITGDVQADSDLDIYRKRFTPEITDADVMAVEKMPREKSDELKSKIKFADPAKIFLPARKSGYICPFCGDGSGRDGDGVKPTTATDGYVYHCFRQNDCEGDLLNVIATANNLSLKKDFFRVLAIGQKILETAYNSKFDDIKPPDGIASDDDDTQTVFYIQWDIFTYSKTAPPIPETERRGLTLETLNFVQAFWYERWIHPKFRDDPEYKIKPTRRIIFPTTKRSYAALIAPSDRNKIDAHYKKNLHAGKENHMYYAVDKNVCTKPYKFLLVTEGEIDAVSILQATGHKYLVGATGGAAKYKKIVEFAKNGKSNGAFDDDFLVILMFDADETGRTNVVKAVKALNAAGFLAAEYLIDPELDANAYLQKYGDDALKNRIEEIISDAESKLPQLREALKNIPPEENVGVSSTRKKIPSCPVDLLIPGGYGIDEYCIAEQGKPFTATPTVITRSLVDVDSGKNFSELAYYKKATGKWKRGIVVQDDVIADTKKFLPLASDGIDVTTKTAKSFVVYLMSLKHFWRNDERIPKVFMHNFTGWTDKTYKTFIYPSHPTEGHILKNEEKDYGDNYAAFGSYDKWREKVTELYNLYQTQRFNSGVFLLTLAVSLAAPAIKFLKTRNLQLLLSCSTGSGKSCVAKAAISVYGDPLALKNTFDGTAISLSELSTYYNCLPMWIDEFQSAKKGLREEIDKFIYSYAESVPRLRCKRIGGLNLDKQKAFYGTRIMTGEESMLRDNSNAGAFNRLLIVTTDKIFPEGWNISATHRFFENNCGHFGEVWIKYLSEHAAEIKEDFDKALDGDAGIITTDVIKSRHDWADNWKEFFMVLYVVLKHALPLMINGYNEIDFITNYCNMITAVTADVPSNNSNLNHERAKVLLEDYINSHNKNFNITVLYPNGEMRTHYHTLGQTLQGYIDEELRVDIIPSELTKILEKDLGFSSAKSIIREFAKAGWLEYSQKSAESKHRPYQRNVKAYSEESKTLKWSWVYRFKAGSLQINTDTIAIED